MPLGSILSTLDVFGLHFGSLGLSGVALDLILQALGDILGMAWVPDWPGDPEWAGLHSGSSGSSVLLDPGIQNLFQVEGDLMLLGPTIN